jgi:hypothetical protein
MFNDTRREVLVDLGEEVIVSTGACIHCREAGSVTLPKEVWLAWDNGRGPKIQYLWPEGSPGDREQLINGTHDACFNEMFPEEEQ